MTRPLFRSSGDLRADARFDYACGSAARGDDAAAADLFEQALELTPAWAPAWIELALARQRLGRPQAAEEAFREAARHDIDGSLGAALHLARYAGAPMPAAAPPAYVRGLFDQYAGRFETHLVDGLAYRAPQLLAEAIAPLGRPLFARVGDLGCGTGLAAPMLRERAAHLTGVDLSPAMIDEARAKNLYDRLEIGDIVAFLRAEPPGSLPLLVAADVLVYCGDLAPVFAAAARAMAGGGFFAFTLQTDAAASGVSSGVSIGADLRFRHDPAYVAATATAAGLRVVTLHPASSRREAGRDVPGLVCVLTTA